MRSDGEIVAHRCFNRQSNHIDIGVLLYNLGYAVASVARANLHKVDILLLVYHNLQVEREVTQATQSYGSLQLVVYATSQLRANLARKHHSARNKAVDVVIYHLVAKADEIQTLLAIETVATNLRSYTLDKLLDDDVLGA